MQVVLLLLAIIVPSLVAAGLIPILLHRRKRRFDQEVSENATLSRSFWGSMHQPRRPDRKGRPRPAIARQGQAIALQQQQLGKQGHHPGAFLRSPSHKLSLTSLLSRMPRTPETPTSFLRPTTAGSHVTTAELRQALAATRTQALPGHLVRISAAPDAPCVAFPLPPAHLAARLVQRSGDMARSGSIPLVLDWPNQEPVSSVTQAQDAATAPVKTLLYTTVPDTQDTSRPCYIVRRAVAAPSVSGTTGAAGKSVRFLPISSPILPETEDVGSSLAKEETALCPSRAPPLPPVAQGPLEMPVCALAAHNGENTGRWSFVSDESSRLLLEQSRDWLAYLTDAAALASEEPLNPLTISSGAAQDEPASVQQEAQPYRQEAVLSYYRPDSILSLASATSPSLHSRQSDGSSSSWHSTVLSIPPVLETDDETLVETTSSTGIFQFDLDHAADEQPSMHQEYAYEPAFRAYGLGMSEEEATADYNRTRQDSSVRLTKISEAASELTNSTGQPWYRWF